MPLQLGELLNERYRIERVLGQGGMGAVYLATDQSLNVPCAVKENLNISAASERLFKREATLLATLRHPNLPRVTNHFILNNQQYLVMDYVEGEDLKQRLAAAGPIPEKQALVWITQVGDALIYLHGLNPPVIHRDIKPANIRLTAGEEAMLVDFGIAKVVNSDQQTATGTAAFTPGFAPPEQYGLGATDTRTDQYALAATFYALLTGNAPPDSVERLLGNVKLIPPHEARPDISTHISQALVRALEVKPEDRFDTLQAFKRALYQAPNESAAHPAAPTEATLIHPTGAGLATPTVQKISTPTIVVPPSTPPKRGGSQPPSRPPTKPPSSAPETIAHLPPPPIPDLQPALEAPLPLARRVPWGLIIGGGLGMVALIVIAAMGGMMLGLFAPPPTPTSPPTVTLTAHPSATATALPSATAEPPTPTATPTVTEPPLPTDTSIPTETPLPTDTPSPTETPTPAGTPIGSGGRIAFISNRDGQHFQVYTMNVNGGEVQALTTDPLDKWSPTWPYNGTQLAWSPDGQHLIYVAEGGGANGLDLWVINADGTGAQNLTNTAGDDYQPTFCASGGLWFASKRVNNVPQVLYYNSLADALAGKRPTNFSGTHNNTSDFDPTLYPECGKALTNVPGITQRAAFVSTLDGALEIWRFWTDCPECYRKVRTYKTERGVADEPALSPDGKDLLYTRRLNGANEILRANVAKASHLDDQQLTSTLDNFSAQWSPDGQWIVFVSNRDGNREIYVMSRDGVGQTNLTNNPAVDTEAVWQP
jgi:serine/threonine protein kinase